MSSRLEQKLAAFSSLIEIAATINASLDPDDVLPTILNQAQRVMDANAVSVALIDEATHELVYIEATGEHGGRVKGGIRLKVGPGSIGGWVAENGQTLVIADVPNDPRFNLAAAKRIGLIPRSMVCVPMRAQDAVIGILQAIDPRNKAVFDEDDGEFFQAFASFAATAIQNAHLHKALLIQQSEQQETEFARQIQESFLPKTIPAFEGISISSHYKPAREVGGDFYDIIQLSPTKVGLVVGDVTGKGIAASLYMVRGLFETRRLASAGLSPAEVLNEINVRLAAEADAAVAADAAAGRTRRPPIFLGLLYATLDVATRQLRYANADLPPPILHRADRRETLNESGGPAIGMLPGLLYTEGVTTLACGETLLLYTDGLNEARNLGRVEFGYERIGESLAQPHSNATEAVKRIADEVNHFIGSADRHDDLTMLALHLTPSSDLGRSSEMKPHHSLTIKSHPRHQAEVRQFVRNVAAESGMPEEITFKMVLAVDEAITNIIRHAYGGDENQEIVLRAESTPEVIEFRLRDFGCQAEPETFKSRDLADVRPGGLGCHLIEQGFDTVTYDINFPRGTELRLIKRLVR